MTQVRSGSVLAGMIWMLVLSLLLFWLPTFGPLIAGAVGGKRAGGVGPGLLAALLPSLVLAAGLAFFATALTGLPLIGAVAGMGTMVLLLLEIGPLLVGALIGGLLAD
jgi:hypothetical protein